MCPAGSRRLAPRLRVGERQDLLRSAAGRALLLDMQAVELGALWECADAGIDGSCAAFLGRLGAEAASGWTLDHGDHHGEAEVVTIAAPVRGGDGTIRAALGLAFAATYQARGMAAPARESLRRCAEALSQELGWRITKRQSDADSTTADGLAERELLGGAASGKGAGRMARRRATLNVPPAGIAGGPQVEDLGVQEAEDQGTKGRGA